MSKGRKGSRGSVLVGNRKSPYLQCSRPALGAEGSLPGCPSPVHLEFTQRSKKNIKKSYHPWSSEPSCLGPTSSQLPSPCWVQVAPERKGRGREEDRTPYPLSSIFCGLPQLLAACA